MDSRFEWGGWLAILLGVLLSGCRERPTVDDGAAKESAPAQDAVLEQADAALVLTPSKSEHPSSFVAEMQQAVAERDGDAVVKRMSPENLQAIEDYFRQWSQTEPALRKEFLDAMRELSFAIANHGPWLEASDRLVAVGSFPTGARENIRPIAQAFVKWCEWPGWMDTGAFDSSGFVKMAVERMGELPFVTRFARDAHAKFQQSDDGSWLVRWSMRSEAGDETFVPANEWMPIQKVDTIWVPKFLVDYGRTHAEGRQQGAMSAEGVQSLVGIMNAATDALNGVKSQDEFDALVDLYLSGFRSGPVESEASVDSSSSERTSDEPKAVGRGEMVTLRLQGELPSDKATDALVWELTTKTDDPISAVVRAQRNAEAGTLDVQMGPVADLKSLSERLDGYELVTIDEAQRVLTVKRRDD